MNFYVGALSPNHMVLGYALYLNCNKEKLKKFYEVNYDKFNSEEVQHFEIYEIVEDALFEVKILLEAPLNKNQSFSFIHSPLLTEIEHWVKHYTTINSSIFYDNKDSMVYSYERVKSGTKNAAKTS